MQSNVLGAVVEIEFIVTPEMTAELDGKEIHPVYSTFWLAKHAETVARKAVEPFFEYGENAVGAELSVRHEAMTHVGAKVVMRAKVVKVETKKIVCEIEAFSGGKRIASGSQTQIVLPDAKIKELVAEAYSRKS